MSKRVIYVVTRGSTYGDEGHCVIGLHYRHSRAKKRIEDDKKYRASRRNLYDKSRAVESQAREHQDEWAKDHPMPVYDRSLLKDIPKWHFPPGQPNIVTDEMRAERAAIVAYNDSIAAEHTVRAKEWQQIWGGRKDRLFRLSWGSARTSRRHPLP